MLLTEKDKEIHNRFSKQFQINYKSEAITLDPCFIGANNSGWIIEGKEKEDYYTWVNYFEAYHSNFGYVWGDFEDTVYASSEKAYNHFYENHKPIYWDYGDI